jgi:hypothetical protein
MEQLPQGKVRLASEPVNPYRPPLAELGRPVPRFVPEPFDGIGRVVASAIALYLRHFGRIALLTLAAYAPVELVKNWIVYHHPMDDWSTARADVIIGSLVGALLSPAIIYAVVEPYRTGRATTRAALGYGARRWAETFGANFVAGIQIVLAALLFIVPGLVVWLWYLFVAEVVALEPRAPDGPLSRSKAITAGFRWRLVGVFFVVGMLYLAVAFGAGLVFAVVDNWGVASAIDLVLDLAYPVLSLTGLVAYVSIVHGPSRDPTWVDRVRWAPTPAIPAAPAGNAPSPAGDAVAPRLDSL